MFEGLKERIRSQQREMRNGDYLRDLRDEAAFLIADYTPQFTGTMARNLTLGTPVREDAQGLHAGLGDRNLVGFENRGAPRGTIWAFLQDYPQFRTRTEQRAGGRAQAWRDLPYAGKEILQKEREAGAYGGADQGVGAEKSAYFFPQEGTLDGWNASGMKADILPLHFVEHALVVWRASARAKVLANWLNRTGFR